MMKTILKRSLEKNKLKFWKKNSSRYIIKYKNANRKDPTKLESVAKTAFEKGKSDNEQKEEARLERFKELDEEKVTELKGKKSGNVTDKQKRSLTPDVEIMVLTAQAEEFDVIELSEGIKPEAFVEQVENEMGDIIEYMQPDYFMELSDTKDSNIIDLELGSTQEIIDDESTPEPENDEEAITPEPENDEKVVTAGPTAIEEQNDEENLKNIEQNQSKIDLDGRLHDIDVDLHLAWEISRGEGITVALIDTGIDVNHQDLTGHMTDGWDFVNETSEVYNFDLGLEQAHGTHLAGIIAKTAPDAQIIPLKVFENGRAYTSDIIRAIEYAKQNGATIVNCSFGSTDNNQALREAMEKSELFFVCAAGNSRTNLDETEVYPAAFNIKNTISVAALNQDLGMSYFSNYGTNNVDISAWGRDIYSCFPNNEYGTMSGTSMSAAYVTGAAALIMVTDYQKNLKETLKNASDRLSCLDGKVCSNNKLNFYGAVSGKINNGVIEINSQDDYDVNGYERTTEENWELFSSLDNVQAVAGGYHTLVLKSDGSVWAWGDNKYGQLGDGTNNDSNVPIKVVGLPENIITVSAGLYNTMALTEGGQVYCWGFNHWGQLGNGNRADKTVPSLTTFDGGYPFYAKEISMGYDYSVAISTLDVLTTWGRNWNHQLGSRRNITGEDTRDCVDYPEYAYVRGNWQAEKVSAGCNHTIGLTLNGALITWGNNSYGELGVSGGNIINENSNLMTEYEPFKDISAGNFFTLALSKDGTIFAWGENSHGQLGNNSINNKDEPVIIDNIINIKSISAGQKHVVALAEDGDLYVWGSNRDGELGDGTNEDRHLPYKLTGGENQVRNENEKISASENHVIIINSNGTVSSSGDNTYGQLGDETNRNNKGFVTVKRLSNIIEVAAGENYSLALDSDGYVHSWGNNSLGTLGTGNTNDSNIPIKIKNLSNIVKISAGQNHVLALDSNGVIYSWGNGRYGQLGNMNTSSLSPQKVVDHLDVIDISAGYTHNLAVRSNGDVWAWGKNDYGKIGVEGASTGVNPLPKRTLIKGVVSVSAGENHSIARQPNGEVYAWGANTFGQLGVTAIDESSIVRKVHLTNIAKIITMKNHNIAIDKDGYAYSWGANLSGQLGRKTDEVNGTIPAIINSTKFQQIAVGSIVTYAIDDEQNLYKWGAIYNTEPTNYFENVPFQNKIIDISARRNSVVAVDKKGDVYTWGDGSYWDLGHNSDKNEYHPRKVEGISNVKKVAKSKHSTYALDKDGQVWGWGKNTFEGSDKIKTPRKATKGTGIIDISATETDCIALKTDGTVWSSSGGNKIDGVTNVSQIVCGNDFTVALSGNTIYTWGGNEFGQLGDGTNENRDTPQAISGSYTKVYTNSNHVLAIGTDGRLYSWGRNSINQLGLNDSGKINRNTPTVIPIFNKKVIAAGTGNSTSMATLEDGTVWTWGEGRSYQFGNGMSQTSWLPIINNNIQDLRILSGGNDFMVAVDKSGTLYTAGANNFGQRGLMSYEPVLVDMSPDEIEDDNKVIESVEIVAGEMYVISISANNISNFNDKEFVFEYDTSQFELIDAVGHTYGKDTIPGQASSSDITITECVDGNISFTKNAIMLFGNTYSGFINSIKLKAKVAGDAEISLSIN